MRGLRSALRLPALLTAALCAGCAPADPVESSDGEPRIAALSPAIAITLADLGLESRIVGRHAYDLSLSRDVPVVGDQEGVDYESLLGVAPTHVLLEWGARELPPRLIEISEERGWVVRSLPLLTLADIRAAVRTLTSMFESPQTSERAALLEARMDEAWSQRPGIEQAAGRVLPLYWTDPPGVAGPGSFHFQILEALGATPAIEDGRAYFVLDPEDIRRLDPDSILLIIPGADPSRIDELLGPLARLDLRAVREGRVGVVAHPHGQTPSTAMIEVADEMTRVLLGWSRATPDER